MSDRGVIVAGLALFVALASLPVWYNRSAGTTPKAPEIKLPTEGKDPFGSREFMRSSHMNLLVNWRDEVVRKQERTVVGSDGKTYTKSLTGTCLGCHASKADFCDRCHGYAGITPTCWDCHIDPKQARRSPSPSPLPLRGGEDKGEGVPYS